MAKHFLKTLVIFIVMIIIGLLGVYLVNYFDDIEKSGNMVNSYNELAE